MDDLSRRRLLSQGQQCPMKPNERKTFRSRQRHQDLVEELDMEFQLTAEERLNFYTALRATDKKRHAGELALSNERERLIAQHKLALAQIQIARKTVDEEAEAEEARVYNQAKQEFSCRKQSGATSEQAASATSISVN